MTYARDYSEKCLAKSYFESLSTSNVAKFRKCKHVLDKNAQRVFSMKLKMYRDDGEEDNTWINPAQQSWRFHRPLDTALLCRATRGAWLEKRSSSDSATGESYRDDRADNDA